MSMMPMDPANAVRKVRPFLGHQVVEGKRKRRETTLRYMLCPVRALVNRATAASFRLLLVSLAGSNGLLSSRNLTIVKLDDAIGVVVGEPGTSADHDDQTAIRQQVHDLMPVSVSSAPVGSSASTVG